MALLLLYAHQDHQSIKTANMASRKNTDMITEVRAPRNTASGEWCSVSRGTLK